MDNQEAIRLIRNLPTMCEFTDAYGEPIDSDAYYEAVDIAISALQARVNNALEQLPGVQTNVSDALYEYHYDHTDCIWYRPEARNRCPSTCAQYRDGWNDAMNYIFRDGKGYRPYRRNEQYGE